MRIQNLVVIVAVAAAGLVLPGLVPTRTPGTYPTGQQIVPDTPAAIALFQERVEVKPNPIDFTLLAQLHLRRSRETGDVSELSSAETALSEAIAERPNYAPAVLTMASVEAAQHRFEEALTTARRARDLEPRLGAEALIGDVLVATGDYEGAAVAYSHLAVDHPSPGLSARMAHLEELSGEIESAILRTERATAAHLAAGGVGEEAAWYQIRLGDLNFATGDLVESDRRYNAALELLPEYWPALVGQGKVNAARGDVERAIELFESAASFIPRPEIMVALGDLYTISGEPERAGDSYATVEVIANLSSGVYDRNLALYYAEHGEAARALELANAGLRERHDIYGYDTLAWALYHLGRFAEAREAMDQALVLGTRDSFLHFHSGAIWLALGEESKAIRDLGAALDLNPYFHPLHANSARQMLSKLAT